MADTLLQEQCDVLLLSAGFGKRLRPITDKLPKPLVMLGRKTLLDWNLDIIARAGLRRVFVNVHYRGEQIREHLTKNPRKDLEIVLVEEPILLDTGGAIRNIEPQLVCRELVTLNSDNFFGPEFSLANFVNAHRAATDRRVATLCVRKDPNAASYGQVGLNKSAQVCHFLGTDYGPADGALMVMYAGVQVLERRALSYMPPRGEIFSITRDTHVKMLASGEVIGGYLYDGYWSDVGTPERLVETEKAVEHIYGVSQAP